MKVIVFDIWGDYGHFRKFYTTSSPLTFSFPPPPTIAGMLGAIYGTDKGSNEYLKLFGYHECRTALRILIPIKKVRMGLNHVETRGKNLKFPMSDKNLKPRTQIRTELIKSPHFRIYVSHRDEKVFQRLCENIKNHKSFFSLSLGLSELLADFKYIGLYEAIEISNGEAVEITTPVVVDNLLERNIVIECGKRYFSEKIPIIMNQDRVVEKYEEVIFEPDGKTLMARLKSYFTLENGENIAFF